MKTPSDGGGMEIQKAMLSYYEVTFNVYLRHSQTFHCDLIAVRMARKHINEHRIVYDNGLSAMVKTAQVGDLRVHANLVCKLVAYH